MVPERHLNSDLAGSGEYARRYQALMETADLAVRQGLPQLLKELAHRVHEIFASDFLTYALHCPAKNILKLHVLESSSGTAEDAIELSVDSSPFGWAWSNQKPLVLTEADFDDRFLATMMNAYKERGLRSLVVLPMTTGHARLGALGFGSTHPVNYDEERLSFLSRVTGLVALAVENSLSKEMLAREAEKLESLSAINTKLAALNERTHHELQQERDRLQTLVEISSALVESRLDLQQMFPAIADCLKKSVIYDAAVVNVWRESERCFEVYSLQPHPMPGVPPQGLRIPAEKTGTWEVLSKSESAIVGRGQLRQLAAKYEHVKTALDAGLVCWCTAAMRTANGLVGVLYLGSRKEDAFGEKDLDLLKQVARVSALFVENALTHQALHGEKERLRLLLEVSRASVSSLDLRELFNEISTCIHRVVGQDHAHLALHDAAVSGNMQIHTLDFPFPRNLISAEATAVRLSESPAGIAFQQRETKCFDHNDLEEIGSEFARKALQDGIRSVCCCPLISRGRALGVIGIASARDAAFSATEIELLEQVAPQIAIAIDNAEAYREIASLRDKLTKEKLYLEEEIRDVLNLEEIVGESQSIKRVLEQVKTVAPSNATTLITGETGTGKELIARAIHRLSSRHEGNFVKLNCAAIPTGLLESELFGHEKGAFTGAVSQKVGRLELADRGTLFLDEIGEIPLELQPKLLRVLQDHEFERLGGTRTIRVNVRLVAATNRDLAQAVAKHEFRSDLFYRLHVFPVRMPPLRERPGDIPLLVRYFVQKFARRMNKHIETIPNDAMHALENWNWPGNIRELENFLERSVILTDGPVLRIPIAELRPLDARSAVAQGTLEELEREYILQVLRQAGGVVSGSQGAAARLGMKRTTLQSKIQRLGVLREEYGS
jgi:formate hydrogenlyase transcriptional activator